MKKIAFLGVGVMGSGMAMRLLEAGFPVTVWNRNAARAEPLRQKGAAIAPSPRQAAETADVVIAMVADDNASRAVWTGKDGALAGLREGVVAIECSTLSPELAASARPAWTTTFEAPSPGALLVTRIRRQPRAAMSPTTAASDPVRSRVRIPSLP